MNNKSELRIIAKDIRKTLPLENLSKKAVEKIRMCNLYCEAQNVMIYYPTLHEINLLELLKDNKNFYLPRVNGVYLDICPYKTGDTLKKSNFGIYEPTNESVECNILDLVIVPALMADSQDYRLGYGGGYYDRFLCNSFKTIVVIPKELYVEKLPTEQHDKKTDKVIII